MDHLGRHWMLPVQYHFWGKFNSKTVEDYNKNPYTKFYNPRFKSSLSEYLNYQRIYNEKNGRNFRKNQELKNTILHAKYQDSATNVVACMAGTSPLTNLQTEKRMSKSILNSDIFYTLF